jgi:hypothetical protein
LFFFYLGNYTAIFQVSNSIDSTNLSCVVQVLPILQQVYYSLIPANWPFNAPASFAVSVYIGDPNPGSVVYTWDFGDGTNISSARTGKKIYSIESKKSLFCIYSYSILSS